MNSLLVVWSLLAAPPAGALSVTDAPLVTVVAALARQLGIDVLSEPSLADRTITLNLPAQPPAEQLRALALAVDLRVQVLDATTYLLLPSAAPPVAQPNGRAMRQAIRLEHQTPSVIVRWLTEPVDGRKPLLALPPGVGELAANDDERYIAFQATQAGATALIDLIRELDQPVRRLAVEAWLLRLTPAEAEALDIPATPPASLDLDALLDAAQRVGVPRRYRFDRLTVDNDRVGTSLLEVDDVLPDGTVAPVEAALRIQARVTGAEGQEFVAIELTAAVGHRPPRPDDPRTRYHHQSQVRVPAGRAALIELTLGLRHPLDDQGLRTLLLVRAVPEPVD